MSGILVLLPVTGRQVVVGVARVEVESLVGLRRLVETARGVEWLQHFHLQRDRERLQGPTQEITERERERERDAGEVRLTSMPF